MVKFCGYDGRLTGDLLRTSAKLMWLETGLNEELWSMQPIFAVRLMHTWRVPIVGETEKIAKT